MWPVGCFCQVARSMTFRLMTRAVIPLALCFGWMVYGQLLQALTVSLGRCAALLVVALVVVPLNIGVGVGLAWRVGGTTE